MAKDKKAKRDIVVIGASSGGIEALKSLVSRLPARLEAALFVILHTSAESPVFFRHSGASASLAEANACDRETIEMGRIYSSGIHVAEEALKFYTECWLVVTRDAIASHKR